MCEMRTLSKIIGWIHLIASAIMAISLLVCLCIYNNKTYEDTEEEWELELIGLHTLLLLFLFFVVSVLFDVLLLKGLAEDRIKYMAPFVYCNYVALGLIIFVAIVNFIADLIQGDTFGDIIIHIIQSSVSFGVTFLLFYPIYKVYSQLRDYPDQPESHHLSSNTPVKYVHGGDV